MLGLVLACLAYAAAALAQGGPATEPTTVAAGRVTAEDGTPLAGARVTLLVRGGFRDAAYTGRDGRFQVPIPTGGASTVRVTKAGFAPADHDLAADAGEAVIRLAPGGVITGRVDDERGGPIVGGTVRVRPVCAPACTDAGGGAGPFAVETDDRGVYRLGSLPAGHYEVHLAPSRFTATMTPAVAVAGPGTSVVDSGEPVGDGRSGPASLVVALRPGDEAIVHLARFIAAQPAPGGAAPDTASPVRLPTPIVRGRITAADGRPIEDAAVTLTALDGTAVRIGRSDAGGHYEVTGVPPTEYRLTVVRQGFSPVAYGQRRASEPGRTIVVGAGDVLEGIDVVLPPGGVIAGRVVDGFGEPLEGVTVDVWERRISDGRIVLARPMGVSARRTDDRGSYRLAGLLPGIYHVSASDDDEPPVSALLQTALQAAGQVVALSGTGASLPPRSPARIYYPRGAATAEASPVRIERGLDAAGIDIVFVAGPTAHVIGRAVDSTGRPVEGSAELIVSHRSGAPAPRRRLATIGPDGRFTFEGVPPGDYVVQVATGVGLPPTMPALMSDRDVARIRDADREFGMVYLDVTGAGTVETVVRTAPGVRVAARIVVEGDRSRVEPSSFQLALVPADHDRSPGLATFPPSTGADPWVFERPNLHGRVRFALHRAPSEWYLRSALVHGTDAAEHPVDLDGSGGSRVEVDVVVAIGGQLVGQVTDALGAPAADYAVVVFPTDATRWYDRSRHLKLARSALDGTFSVTGLPPGEYWIVAVDRIAGDETSGEWQSLAVLGSLVSSARRVRVDGGQRVPVDLRLTRMPDP